MTRLQKMQPAEHSILTQVLFGQTSITPVSDTDLKARIKWNDTNLNTSQQDAIRFALASREVALIHGPPGTGKTHTLIELIRQLLARGQRLLVCGPSNLAVDNIVERLSLADKDVKMIRLGHPARLLPAVLAHSMEVLSSTSEAAAIVQDVRADMDARQTAIRKTRNGRERKVIYGELRELRKEFREREGRVAGDLLRASQVVLTTLHGAGGYQLKDQRFDVVIVDEASQALEAQCWIPVLTCGAPKLVLAGDHLQLPPTIKSLNSKIDQKTGGSKGDKKTADSKAAKTKTKEVKTGISKLQISDDKSSTAGGKRDGTKPSKENASPTLEITLFDRLLALYGGQIKRMLTTQYRMHEKIMAFPSDSLYENKLIAAEAVEARLLKDLPYPVQDTDDTREPLVFWDTQGGDFPETSEENDSSSSGSALLAESKINGAEVSLVHLHVGRLIDAGVRVADIAVITPYNGQRAMLAAKLAERFPGLELSSVDGFQGREKEAIVLSLVRSNTENDVGFLAEKRRLNGELSTSWLFLLQKCMVARAISLTNDHSFDCSTVAMTRPKRHLCVIGDSETISK